MRYPLFLLLASFLALSACDSTPTDECPDGPDCEDGSPTILVGNQGNFTDESGSVTVIDIDTGTAEQDAFGIESALVQQIVLDSEQSDIAYVLLNYEDSFSAGRGLVAIINTATGERVADVEVNTPRDAVRVGDTLWVTNLYSNSVTPIDLTNNTAGDPVAVGTNPEGIVFAGANLFVANFGFGFSTTVSRIDPATGAVAQTIDVECDGPRSLALDSEGEVWVFCSGKTVFDFDTGEVIERTDGEVVILNGGTGAEQGRIELSTQLGTDVLGQDVATARSLDAMWAVVNDTADVAPSLYRFDTAGNSLAERVTLDIQSGALGAVAYSKLRERLFLGIVPADLVTPGEVVAVTQAGDVVERYAAGIIPSAIAVR